MSKHGIEWTDETWNPLRGCSIVSAGCLNCYAMKIAHRYSAPGMAYENLTERSNKGKVRWTGEVRLVPAQLNKPLHWKKPRRVFVNSMSDLFHETVPLDYIQDVFKVMRKAKQHQFQILTKRSDRLRELDDSLAWAPNIWMGVSVENNRYTYRADHLRETGAQVKFISVEPLIGPVPSLSVKELDWVIVGGESGTGARPMDLDWARKVRDKCLNEGVAFFLKQLGGVRDKRGEEKAILDGRRWTEYPDKTSTRKRATRRTTGSRKPSRKKMSRRKAVQKKTGRRKVTRRKTVRKKMTRRVAKRKTAPGRSGLA